MAAIDPEMAFQQLISADPRFSAMGASIYSVSLPEAVTFPAICMWCFEDKAGQTFDGLDGLDECSWRFDCYALSYDEVKQLRRIVKDTLIMGNDQLAGGGKLVTTPDGIVNIQSTKWRGGGTLEFDRFQQKVFGYEIEIEICVMADAQ